MSRKKTFTLMVIIALFLVATITVMLVITREKPEDKHIVGVILTGKETDIGWNGTHYSGVKEACDTLGVELITKEDVLEETYECEGAIEELAEAGASIIILSSYGYPAQLQGIFEQYPEIAFYGISDEAKADNYKVYFGRMYQARYLSGIIAAHMSESGNIGYVAAMPNNEVNRGINAFTLGVRSVNPEATVTVMWSNSWDDQEEERLCANKLMDLGADVLAYHQNQPYVTEEAEARGVYSIGYNEHAANFSEKYLTSAVWNWSQLYTKIIREKISDSEKNNKRLWIGIEDEVVGLADYSPLVTEQIKMAVESAKAEILAGNDVFSGRIVDTEGNVRCEEGESISDNALMNDFDWYVEGVIIYEE